MSGNNYPRGVPPGQTGSIVAKVLLAERGQRDGWSALRQTILACIRSGEDFPATASAVNLITELSASEDATINELSNIVLRDYGLTSKILRLLNSVYFFRFGEVTTVSRAIILLGVQKLKNIVLSMSIFEKLGQKDASHHLTDVLAKAVYSGVIGSHVAATIGFPFGEEVFIGALFRFLGEILIAYYLPDEYAKLRELQSERRPGAEKTAMTAGALYEEVGLAIATEWRFPEKVLKCMRNLETEKDERDTLQCICIVAGKIAEMRPYAAEGQAGMKESLNTLLKSIGGEFALMTTQAIEDIITHAENDVEEYLEIYGIRAVRPVKPTMAPEPGSPPPDIIKELNLQIAGAYQSESGAEEQKPDLIFASGLQDVTNAIVENYDLNDVFRIILETIYRATRHIRENRVIFLVRDRTKPVLTVRLALGESIANLGWLAIAVNPSSSDVFNLALKQNQGMVIENTGMENAGQVLPPGFLEHLTAPSFLTLFPLVVKDRSIGLVYLQGRSEDYEKITPTHFNYLKILHKQIVLAIKQQGTRHAG